MNKDLILDLRAAREIYLNHLSKRECFSRCSKCEKLYDDVKRLQGLIDKEEPCKTTIS
jgi:hypothetical protein